MVGRGDRSLCALVPSISEPVRMPCLRHGFDGPVSHRFYNVLRLFIRAWTGMALRRHFPFSHPSPPFDCIPIGLEDAKSSRTTKSESNALCEQSGAIKLRPTETTPAAFVLARCRGTLGFLWSLIERRTAWKLTGLTLSWTGSCRFCGAGLGGPTGAAAQGYRGLGTAPGGLREPRARARGGEPRRAEGRPPGGRLRPCGRRETADHLG